MEGSIYDKYVESIPPEYKDRLEKKLDEENGNLDLHLGEIAGAMINWELKLATPLGLDKVAVYNIKSDHRDQAELQRVEALRRWKNSNGPFATYKTLLRIFVNAGENNCAEVLCKVLGAGSSGGRSGATMNSNNTSGMHPPKAANSDEKPRFTDDKETELRQKNKPGKRPGKATPEYLQLEGYCRQIQIILQTVNDHEYYAAITYMKPPCIEGGNFTKAMQFGAVDGTAIGEFAGKKVALIQTDPGSECNDDIEKAIKSFPNAKYLMGIGVCYSLDRSKHKLGDVLISTMIKDLNNFKFLPDGQLEDRGRTIDIRLKLREIFCRRIDDHEPFEVAEKRNSKAFSGTLIGDPHLYNDKVMVEKLKKVAPVAIGGEMEGGQLLKFRESEKLKGVIIIKGVCDYADGSKSKEWQFTAAMAAFNYVESKLSEADSFCNDDDEAVNAEVHED